MQTTTITLLHATRGRAKQAVESRAIWLQAAENPMYVEHIFAFDRDDEESVSALGAYRHVIVEERDKGCVAAWNLAARCSRGDILIQLSDDWIPIKGWDKLICHRFRDVSKPGVLKISDGRRADDLLCMAIFTRRWLEMLSSEFLGSAYFGVYSDDEFSFRAYKAGVVIDARDIVLNHIHPNFDINITRDSTHSRQNDTPRLVAGRELFLKRNPDAMGSWLHDWTDDRYYIPTGHCALLDPTFRIHGGSRSQIDKIAALEADLQTTRARLSELTSTFSWRISKPLRAFDWLLAPSDLTLLRRLYQRYPMLLRLRIAIARKRHALITFVFNLGSSHQNKQAHQDLVKKRAVGAAMPATALDGGGIDVSFVTFNSEKWLRSLMDSLLKQTYPLEKLMLTFVDNGSTDGTVRILEEMQREQGTHFEAFKVAHQSNVGYGPAHHRAITDGKSDLILVSNVDVEFMPDTISKLVSSARHDSTATAAWEPRQIPYEHPKHYDPVTLETNWQSHACILLRRSAYERIGGYDPLIFMYGEDVELSYRFRSHGFKLRYCPSAVIVHHSYSDTKDLSKPLQLAGSVVGNTIIRLRYGTTRDRFAALALLTWRNIYSGNRFRDARRTLHRESLKICRHLRHFLSGKGPIEAGFPFRFFDYELTREGAQHKCASPKDRPLVSIITRTYSNKHRARLLLEAGMSVGNQTYMPIEWIVVQDGGECQKSSSDRIQERFPHLKVRFLTSPGKGRSHSGNHGLENATGDFCMFLDDDDLLYADHVEVLISAIQTSNAVAAYSLAFEVQTSFDDNGYTEDGLQTSKLHQQEWNYDILKDHNFIPIQALLFPRKLFIERGGFNTELDQLEDWNLWLRYGYENDFHFVHKTTSLFRTPSSSDSRAERQSALHQAYHKARNAAFSSLNKEFLSK